QAGAAAAGPLGLALQGGGDRAGGLPVLAACPQGGEDGAGPAGSERCAGVGEDPSGEGLGGGCPPSPCPPQCFSPVKEEPCDEDPPAKPAQTKGPPGFPRDVSVAELLQRLSLSAEEELLFLQLPDTLPGQPPTQDTKPIKTELQNEEGQMVVVKQEKSQVRAECGGERGTAWGCVCVPPPSKSRGVPRQEAKQAENICTLADLPEGQVGKLLIRKSGKVQLVLGKVTLDVTMGTPCSFLQELVSVGIGDNRTGEMIVLGHVKHKLVCSPDFEALLEHRHR
uniref:RNA polymerase III subunit D n=1 Tax=Athene cunicularia TaxID=194338 RepID=A0A663N6T8_ATHCN